VENEILRRAAAYLALVHQSIDADHPRSAAALTPALAAMGDRGGRHGDRGPAG
jgi:hypothetical protein